MSRACGSGGGGGGDTFDFRDLHAAPPTSGMSPHAHRRMTGKANRVSHYTLCRVVLVGLRSIEGKDEP